MLHAYVGTYTGRPLASGRLPGALDFAHGHGIYLVDIDGATGAMSTPRLVAETPSPSWLVADTRRGILYAANEGAGTVSAFRIVRGSHALTPINVKPTGGAPVSLALDPSGRYLLAANYGGGSVAIVPIRVDGALGDATDIRPTLAADTPSQSPSPTLRDGDPPAAVHMIGLDHGGRFVIANDAAQDRVFVWRLDGATGKLIANDPPFFAVPRGSFPRHFAFSPDDRFFYNLAERASTLSVADIAVVGTNMRLTPRHGLSTLPADFRGANQTSELLITKDGRHLYAANRGHDTIATFATGSDGSIALLGEVPTQNEHPRSLAFDPAEHFVFSLNQRGDSITAFRIDPVTGLLRYSGQSLAIDSPAAMLFVP